MSVMMVRAEVTPERVPDVEAATHKMFAAIKEAQPQGVRYASCRLSDDTTFVVFLELESADNPLETIPAFAEFQANLKEWLAGPPTLESLRVVGSYGLFGA